MGPQTFISFPLLPFLGSLVTTLTRPKRASERHHKSLPWHECAFKGPPMALGGTPWVLVPRPRGSLDSCTIIHDFSSFRAIFYFSNPGVFSHPGPHPKDSPWGLRPSFPSHFCFPLARLARP